MEKFRNLAMVALLTTVSCSSHTTMEAEAVPPKITITFSSLETGTKTAQRLSELFMQQHPEIAVKTNILPPVSDFMHDDFVNELVNGEADTDIFALDPIWIAEFASMGWLEALDDSFSTSRLGELLSKPLENAYYNEKLYALPWYTDVGVLFYRADLLRELRLDPPTTWSQMIDQAKLLQQSGKVKYGYMFQGNKYEGLTLNFLELFWTNGGELSGGDGVRINTPVAVETLQFMQRLLAENISPSDVLHYKEGQSRERFLHGESAFLRSGPIVWGLSKLPDSLVNGKIGIALLPVGPSGKGSATSIGGASIGMNARIDDSRKSAAIAFMKFLISDEAQKLIALEHSRLPVIRNVYQDPEVLQFNPYYSDIGRMIEQVARFRPRAANYSEMSNVLQTGLHDALSHGTEAKYSLEAMERLIRQLPTDLDAGSVIQ